MTAIAVPDQQYKRISLTPTSGALGMEVTGVDLSEPLDDGLFAEIEQAFHDNLVLVFRDQKIEPKHQLTFTHRFGPSEEHPLGSRRGLDDCRRQPTSLFSHDPCRPQPCRPQSHRAD